MRYLIEVTEKTIRPVVIDSDEEYPKMLERLKSIVETDRILFFKDTDKKIEYRNCTHEAIKFSEKIFNNLKVDFTIDSNTVRVRQYSQSICELFENILEKHDITIPDPDRDSQGEGEDEARIYGETYFNLEDEITNMITEMVNKVKRDEIEVVSDTY